MGEGTVSSSQADNPLRNVKVVLLNGPPRCGKDSIAKQLEQDLSDVWSQFTVYQEKFAYPLRGALKAFLPRLDIEKEKDRSLVELGGGTAREFMIRLSEKFGKTFYGEQLFGHLCVGRMWMRVESIDKNHVHLFIISDSGFLPEAIAVRDAVGAENTVLVRIQRDGCSFHGDSRGYVHLPGVTSADIDNNGSLRTASLHVQLLMSKAWDT